LELGLGCLSQLVSQEIVIAFDGFSQRHGIPPGALTTRSENGHIRM
jgi:hypothetical protein